MAKPVSTAASVPSGMDLAGFFRSPDMPSPDRMPVTAGKNTANTGQKPSGAGTSAGAGGVRFSGVPPRKNDTSEKAMAAMMKYCDFSATSAEKDDTAASVVNVTSPTVCGLQPDTTGSPELTSASAKPAT